MKIFIPEPIPSNNKGEEAILRGILKGLDLCSFNAEVDLFSYDAQLDAKNYNNAVNLISGSTFHPKPKQNVIFKIIEASDIWLRHFLFALLYRIIGEKVLFFFKEEQWKAYIEADLVFAGHDAHISDLNLPLVVFTKILKKKSVIFGGGFLGFKSRLSERFAGMILNRLDLIVLREKQCVEYLLNLGVDKKRIHFKPDPAFIMPHSDIGHLSEIEEFKKLNSLEKPVIGMIAVEDTRDFFHFYGRDIEYEERYNIHIEFCAKMLESIMNITKGTVVFIPHAMATVFGSDDRKCARDIKNKVADKYKSDILLMEENYTAGELKAMIKKLDFIVSQRLHAVIGASGVSTPFLMLTAHEDSRSQDIVKNTIKAPELIYNLNNPTIEGFEQLFNQKWKERKKIEEFLDNRKLEIKSDCKNAFQMLEGIVRMG